jgi:RNA-binding protein with serine-rich domain 1
VTKEHLVEIFSTYGTVKNVELPVDGRMPHVIRGTAHIEFADPKEAEEAMKHMDGGKAPSSS